MPLKASERSDRPGFYRITGTVHFPDGTQQFVRQAAQSRNKRLADEEASTLEADMLRTAWHGERKGTRSFADAVLSYIEAKQRRPYVIQLLKQISAALGDVPLSAVTQETLAGAGDKSAKRKMFGPDPSWASITRSLLQPTRAVLHHAAKQGWCEPPRFDMPEQPTDGHVVYLLPSEARRLILHAAPHLKPLLTYLLCTGSRLGETLLLDWRDVKLESRWAIYWADTTKGKRRRNVYLPPTAITALSSLPHREGRVFRYMSPDHNYHDYVDRRFKQYGGGGQIRLGFRRALERAGITTKITPHGLRHTWATWYLALDSNLNALFRLKEEGGWSSVELVQRYAHLIDSGHEDEIEAFWGETMRERREWVEGRGRRRRRDEEAA